MFCDQCGTQLNADQHFCNHCGKEVVGAVSFAGPRPGRVQAHVRMLGIFWLALSAFDLVGGVVAVILANTLFVRKAFHHLLGRSSMQLEFSRLLKEPVGSSPDGDC